MNLTISDILQAQDQASAVPLPHLISFFMPWGPYIDGVELSDQPYNLFSDGKFTRVPIMIGDVGDEGRIFIYSEFADPVNENGMKLVIDAFYGAASNQV